MTIFLICLFSFLVLLLLGFMIFVLCRGFSFHTYKVSSQLVYDKTYDVHFEEIRVNVDLGNIEVLPSDDEKVHVLIYSDSDLFQVEERQSTLSIVFEEEEGIHFMVPGTKDFVKIYVPQSVRSSFVLGCDFGNITVEEFLQAHFDIEVNMGDISIDKAEKVEIDTDMGDIYVGSVNDLQVIQDMGNLEVDDVSSQLFVESDMGNVSLKSISLKHDSKITVDVGDVEIDTVSNAYIAADVDLGKVDIDYNHRKAPYTLTIECDMGDISVG